MENQRYEELVELYKKVRQLDYERYIKHHDISLPYYNILVNEIKNIEKDEQYQYSPFYSFSNPFKADVNNKIIYSEKEVYTHNELFDYYKLLIQKYKSKDKMECCVSEELIGDRVFLVYKHGKLVQMNLYNSSLVQQDISQFIPYILNIPFEGLEDISQYFIISGVLTYTNNPKFSLYHSNYNFKDVYQQGVQFIFEDLIYSEDEFGLEILLFHNCITYSDILFYFLHKGFSVNECSIVTNVSSLKKVFSRYIEQFDDINSYVKGLRICLNKLLYKKNTEKLLYIFPLKTFNVDIFDYSFKVDKHGLLYIIFYTSQFQLFNENRDYLIIKDLACLSNIQISSKNSIEFTLHSNDRIEVCTVNMREKIELPEKCPICNTKLHYIDSVTHCVNFNCSSKELGRLQHWCSQEGMNIKLLQTDILDMLYRNKLICHPFELYTLAISVRKIQNIKEYVSDVFQHEGKTQAFIEDLLGEIEDSKHVTLSHFIYSLGMYNIRVKRSQDLAQYFKTLDRFIKCSKKELLQIQSIGNTHSDTILTYIKNYKKELVRMNRLLQWKGE